MHVCTENAVGHLKLEAGFRSTVTVGQAASPLALRACVCRLIFFAFWCPEWDKSHAARQDLFSSYRSVQHLTACIAFMFWKFFAPYCNPWYPPSCTLAALQSLPTSWRGARIWTILICKLGWYADSWVFCRREWRGWRWLWGGSQPRPRGLHGSTEPEIHEENTREQGATAENWRNAAVRAFFHWKLWSCDQLSATKCLTNVCHASGSRTRCANRSSLRSCPLKQRNDVRYKDILFKIFTLSTL